MLSPAVNDLLARMREETEKAEQLLAESQEVVRGEISGRSYGVHPPQAGVHLERDPGPNGLANGHAPIARASPAEGSAAEALKLGELFRAAIEAADSDGVPPTPTR